MTIEAVWSPQKKLSPPLVTTWPCFTETMYFLGEIGGIVSQQELWRWRLNGKLRILELTIEQADRMQLLMGQYRDAPMDLADASLVAVAETLSLQTAFTIDRHFYAYRIGDKQAFQVVP
jgi:predicted nucleic acid-binding protein